MPVLLNWLLRLVITNPITVRLVQGGSRRVRHLYIRSGYLAALILVLLFSLLGTATGSDLSYQDLAAAGAQSFQWVSYLQVLLICLLTPIFMAGAIAQESSPRTWEIMLTTPLGAAQIVFGNLFGRLFFVIALLASSLPLFAVTQYFGGVPGRSIFLSYAIAGCSALLVGSIAVMLSVTRTGGRRAVFIFYAGVVIYMAVTFAFDAVINVIAGTSNVTFMTALNPFLALRVLLQPASYAVPGPVELAAMSGLRRAWFGSPVWTYCWLTGASSIVLMVFSAISLRLIASRTGQVPWYRRLFGLGSKGGRTRPPRRVWNNPVAWREAHARGNTLASALARWGFVAVGLVAAAVMLWAYHTGGLAHTPFRYTLLAVAGSELTIVVLATLNMAATAVSREREDGTLDLLLTSSITPKTYLGGKLRGLFTYLLPMTLVPVVTLMLAAGYVIAGGLGRVGGVMVPASVAGAGTGPVWVVLPEAVVVAPLTIPPFVALCVMIGLQWSLKSKGTIGSVVATVAVVFVGLGVLSLCGFQSGKEIPIIGTILATISPATMMYAVVDPTVALFETVESGGLGAARVNLVIGAAISAAGYGLVVYAMRANMVRTFDMTVRKLTGTM
ncbi:MAG: ABC transporter permease subunit [Phycisphaerales bacterium]|nr:ABC transporter permease subunit [Phycisphaerales bacterium]